VGTHGGHINPAKCVFGVREVTFLGYTVTAEGTRPLDEKCGRVMKCSGHQYFAGTIMRSSSWFGQQILPKRWYPLNQTALLTLRSHINFHPVTCKFTVPEWCQNKCFTQRMRKCNLIVHNCTVCSEWLQLEARVRSYELGSKFHQKIPCVHYEADFVS